MDESLQGARHSVGDVLGFNQFLADGGRVDLSEQRFEGGLSIQEDFQVFRVLEIFH